MARVGQGSRDALGVLYQRHQANVIGLAYRFLGRWDVAEDVAQDVFVRVWRAAATFRPDARFTTWLYRVAANLCWDRRRQAAHDQRTVPLHAVARIRTPNAMRYHAKGTKSFRLT